MPLTCHSFPGTNSSSGIILTFAQDFMVFRAYSHTLLAYSVFPLKLCVCMGVCVDNISILQRDNMSLRKSKVSRLISFQGSWLFDLLIL